ncbi:hypothetical protein HYW67_02810 [Candidatus Parcubacteria bacterium]|nr:hypothetical protein [Candidatus Parcubacteria bacterium]
MNIECYLNWPAVALLKRHPQSAGTVAAAAVSRDRSRPGWGWSGTVIRPLLSLAAP